MYFAGEGRVAAVVLFAVVVPVVLVAVPVAAVILVAVVVVVLAVAAAAAAAAGLVAAVAVAGLASAVPPFAVVAEVAAATRESIFVDPPPFFEDWRIVAASLFPAMALGPLQLLAVHLVSCILQKKRSKP